MRFPYTFPFSFAVWILETIQRRSELNQDIKDVPSPLGIECDLVGPLGMSVFLASVACQGQAGESGINRLVELSGVLDGR